jgi:SAM-dependent methyltransferase
MKSDIVRRLADLNRAFYQTFAGPFAATRLRIQPGAQRLLRRIPPGSSVADLGCGNGNAAAWLAAHAPPRRYLGLDSSECLVEIARARGYAFPAEFRTADVLDARLPSSPSEEPFEYALVAGSPFAARAGGCSPGTQPCSYPTGGSCAARNGADGSSPGRPSG